MGSNALGADAGAEGSGDADDFKRIAGIGPVIERHLREAGVRTFAQLAALSPDQLADLVAHLPLLSVERIVRQDWPGRARALSREAERQPAPDDGVAPGERVARFNVELLLDAHSRVARTRAIHLPGGAEESWDGWSVDRLAQFVAALVPGLDSPRKEGHSAMEPSPAGGAGPLLELGELRVEADEHDDLDGPAPDAGLRAWLPFALAGPAAAQLAAEEPPYCVAILAVDPAGGAPLVLGAHNGRLLSGRHRYEPVVALAPPREGRFQLIGVVLIARAGLVQSALGPVLYVVG